MTLRSRRSSSIDLSRLVAAVRGPNVDTRIWTSYGYAAGDSQVDSKHGVFVDVVLLPGGEAMTAKVGSPYAGAGFGFYGGKIHKDDLLEISIPLGDPDEGAFVTARHWSAGFTPPQKAIDNPDDLLLALEKDKKFRVVTSGEGTISFITEKKVFLGEEDAEENVIIGKTFRDKQKSLNDSLKQGFSDLSSALDQLSTAINTFGTGLTFAGVLIPAAAAAMKLIATAFGTQGMMAASAAKMAADNLKAAVDQFESDADDNQNLLSNTTFTKK